ncbi:hypothetical protein S40285_00061 [Stachybotrys chlorohalonatus IBT 40285]|uniref:Sugar phosphate phosphatase n=1 Tax=Stachybotrys chlorohalonatus (strain IBT 40285) TaxID=1283841 RepID=A0A084QYW5_STAC4|nr:hypothetical protein S40285_00061 [Stachybotrys chlorohalonata IBT 40285]
MEHDTKTRVAVTSDPLSFACESVQKRWPIILTGAIDDVYRAIRALDDPEKIQEGKRIVEQIVALKYEVQHDRQLTPVPDDGFPDEVAALNKELEQRGPNAHWHDLPWIFSECYIRINSFFRLTKHWQSYDVFARQKTNTFRSSRAAVIELAARYREIIQAIRADKAVARDPAAEELLFTEMSEVCLWGNATDLSLLTNMTYEDIQRLQGAQARKAAEANILCNDLPRAYQLLREQRDAGKPERRVDIVLDNAGFELYVDLVLAGYLLATGLATHVVLHPKSIPWFVSDVLPTDFAALLAALADPRAFFETPSEDDVLQGTTPAPLSEKELEDLQFVSRDWAALHEEETMALRPNRYWTAPGSFWRLPHEAPDLLEDLKAAELVIFKGDLNYRKLTGDAWWDPTTPFPTAIGPLGPGSGVNVLSLRTCKADVVVGLPPGKDEELKALEGGGGDSGARRWAWSGKWAVVSLSLGR